MPTYPLLLTLQWAGKADGFSAGSVKPILSWEWIVTAPAHQFEYRPLIRGGIASPRKRGK
jgi:hypothetical protein